ncbi:MAG TPA: ThiF family adenylyltransferase, partial [Anaeromyxobacteraceae bacterium]|nr:ThiF family adenylyltransferase [Anaeromyxobacteraceae bacterium]
MPLTDDVIARYSRQLLVPGFGEAAQERLAAARVRVVGAGAVAGPALVALVQAGVGLVWIDEFEPVGPADLGGWIYPPDAVGTPRVQAARAALEPFSRFVRVEAYPVGGVPTATLVAANSLPQALASAEAARRAKIPHVVLDPDGEGGNVVTIPPGAPCYACARSTSGAGRPPLPGAAALGALAAAELIELVASPGRVPGRRIELVRGVASSRPTARLAGCA